MNVLLIEDDSRVVEFLRRGLRADGFAVTAAGDGREGLQLAAEGQFDIILLDLMLPGMHGHKVCREIRLRGDRTPILMLTAMDLTEDKVTGLRLGADDYLTKPFAFDELVARIGALTRRARSFEVKPKTVTVGDLTFDREALKVQRGGRAIELTAKELAILELLMTAPGKVLSRARILANVWGYDSDPLTNVVDVYIGRLRRKIDGDDAPPLIDTVRGFGYRMNVPTED